MMIANTTKNSTRTKMLILTSILAVVLSVTMLLLSFNVISARDKKKKRGLALDTTSFYKEVGLLVGEGNIPFIADIFFLKGPADSTSAFLAISLSNSQFQFLKVDDGYRANYEVSMDFVPDSGDNFFKRFWTKEIFVGTIQEASLVSETILFQASLNVVPGNYTFRTEVKDLNAGHAGNASAKVKIQNFSRASFAVTQPIFLNVKLEEDPGFSSEIGRQENLITNPRRLFRYGIGDIPYYLEFYGKKGETFSGLSLVTETDDTNGSTSILRTEQLPEFSGQLSVIAEIPVDTLSIGNHEIKFTVKRANGKKLAEIETKFVISLSEQWFVNNWEEAIDYLIYIATDTEIEELKDTPEGDRLGAWNSFWKIKDTVPNTPVNEAMIAYFNKIEYANKYFSSKQLPGWLTDRGRVYMELGPADQRTYVDLRRGIHSQEVWIYDISLGFKLVLLFEGPFPGSLRLTMGSERNFQAALQRLGKI